MTLTVGSRLGHYTIVSHLGQGGMGEVYAAVDETLGRRVALKLIPPQLASDHEALERFRREARAAAAINHPHVVVVHSIEVADSITFLTMELVEGSTLATTIRPGGLPMDRLLDLAIPITDAVGAAHEIGIVHRDLKPANIMVNPAGHVKILDFGLARLREAYAQHADAEPTVLAAAGGPLTGPLRVLGTAAYMSPEQAEGKPADHRSDVFSLGIVLYEMASGERPFKGDSTLALLSAIVKDVPRPLTELAPLQPRDLWRIVRRALAKDVDARYQSAKDLRNDLRELKHDLDTGAAGQPVAATPVSGRHSSKRLWVGAVAALVLSVGALTAFIKTRTSTPTAPPTFEALTFRGEQILQAVFTPDGRRIVYDAVDGGETPSVFAVATGELTPTLILSDARLLDISPSGELAVLRHPTYLFHRVYEGTLARLPLAGGAPRDVLDGVIDAAWAPDGRLAVVRRHDGRTDIEFPFGSVIYSTTGYVNDVRFSRTGVLAFLEHARYSDNAGIVSVIDATGGRRPLMDTPYPWMEGLAWASHGDEILFSAGRSQDVRVHAVRPKDGTMRIVLPAPGSHIIMATHPDGRLLLQRSSYRHEMRLGAVGAGVERDIAWLDWPSNVKFSADGSAIAFAEQSGVFGVSDEVVLRRREALEHLVRLGSGTLSDISRDGRRALARLDDQLVVYPTGAGSSLRLPPLPAGRIRNARFIGDGTRVLILGTGSDGATQLFVQESHDTPPTPLLPPLPGISQAVVSADLTAIVVRTDDHRVGLLNRTDGALRVLAAFGARDVLIDLTADEKGAIIGRVVGDGVVYERMELSTGRRTVLHRATHPVAGGLTFDQMPAMSTDARVYAYRHTTYNAQLFLASGLR